MSAIFNNTTAKVLTATLSGTNAGGRLLICAWMKWDGTALNSVQSVVDLAASTTPTNPHLELSYDATPRLNIGVNGTAAANTTTMSSATWYSLAGSYGPWSGSGVARRMWTNGSLTANASISNTASAVDLVAIAIGRRVNVSAAHKGRMAEVGVWIGLSAAQEDTVVAAAQLYHVDTISIAPNFSWRLSTAVTAATGGVALTNTGTVAFDGADDPSLTTYSAGGSVWVSCSMV